MASFGTDRERATILIVGNDEHLSTALRAAVETRGPVARAAPTLRSARRQLAAIRFIGMILDADLPDGSGLDMLQALRRERFDLHVLVVSGSVDAAIANRAHRLGASCVFKPDIDENVRAFTDRAMAATLGIAERKMAAARGVAVTFHFTDREQKIAELVAVGTPRACLARELGISENTLKTFVRHMLEKSQDTNLDGLARVIHEEVLALACRTEPL